MQFEKLVNQILNENNYDSESAKADISDFRQQNSIASERSRDEGPSPFSVGSRSKYSQRGGVDVDDVEASDRYYAGQRYYIRKSNGKIVRNKSGIPFEFNSRDALIKAVDTMKNNPKTPWNKNETFYVVTGHIDQPYPEDKTKEEMQAGLAKN